MVGRSQSTSADRTWAARRRHDSAKGSRNGHDERCFGSGRTTAAARDRCVPPTAAVRTSAPLRGRASHRLRVGRAAAGPAGTRRPSAPRRARRYGRGGRCAPGPTATCRQTLRRRPLPGSGRPGCARATPHRRGRPPRAGDGTSCLSASFVCGGSSAARQPILAPRRGDWTAAPVTAGPPAGTCAPDATTGRAARSARSAAGVSVSPARRPHRTASRSSKRTAPDPHGQARWCPSCGKTRATFVVR